MDKKIKHLELIQGIIVRMSSNSFSLKGWTVTLVAGLFMAGSIIGSNVLVCLVVLLPIIVFWLLDSYYLLQERLFRALYKKVRNMNEDQIDFDLSSNKPEFRGGKNTFVRCLFSKTEVWFYFALCIVSLTIILLIYFI